MSVVDFDAGSFSLFTLASEVVSSLPFLNRRFLLAGGSLGLKHVTFRKSFVSFIGFKVSRGGVSTFSVDAEVKILGLDFSNICLLLLDQRLMQT